MISRESSDLLTIWPSVKITPKYSGKCPHHRRICLPVPVTSSKHPSPPFFRVKKRRYLWPSTLIPSEEKQQMQRNLPRYVQQRWNIPDERKGDLCLMGS